MAPTIFCNLHKAQAGINDKDLSSLSNNVINSSVIQMGRYINNESLVLSNDPLFPNHDN